MQNRHFVGHIFLDSILDHFSVLNVLIPASLISVLCKQKLGRKRQEIRTPLALSARLQKIGLHLESRFIAELIALMLTGFKSVCGCIHGTKLQFKSAGRKTDFDFKWYSMKCHVF